MDRFLEGRVAVVTGAGGGIGRAVAEEFARQGAKVVVNDLGVSVDGAGGSEGPAGEVVAAIRDEGGEAFASLDSVASMEGGARIVQAAVDAFGRLDIVATPAGILRDRMIFNMTEQEWDAVIAVHLKGTFSVVRPAAALFRQQRGGRIITFSSESGLVGFPGQANYGAAKAGIAGFTKVVARDLGKYGVTVNCVAPRAETRMLATIPPAARAAMEEAGYAPVSGQGKAVPEDVAPFVSYLASDYGSNVNGQIFLVYGGTVSLLSQPRRVRTIFNPNPPGRWDVAEVARLVPPQLLRVNRDEGAAREPELSLAGKAAVVTGAGRGIGRGIAMLLARRGAQVVVNDVGAALDGSGQDQAPAAVVVEEIEKAGGRAVACYESVATAEGGARIVQSAIDAFGRLDIVATPAGILRDRMIFNMTEQEWDDVMDVHLKGTFSIVRPAAAIFREQRSGRIITFSSVSGLYGYSGQSNYGAAKEGIAGFTRVVAKDLERYGVTANAISPSAYTRMTASVPETTREMRRGDAPPPPDGVLTSDPDDVAPMAAWLASDDAAGVTGRVFHCTGNTISLMGDPEPARTIYKDSRWTARELAAVFPPTLGMDLVNPAPPQEA